MTQELIINEELRTLLPPLSDEEFKGLEADILNKGCLSDLIVWNGILIDGHHRYEICKKHEIPFAIKNIVFDDLDAAKLWAWKHQENRRNLTPYHRAEIALKLKDTIAAKAKDRQRAAGGDRTSETTKALPAILPEALAPKETRQELAEIANVGSRTLDKVEFISKNADDETKKKLRQGEKGTSIDKEYKRLKNDNTAQVAPESEKVETKKAGKKSVGKPKKTVTVKLKSSPKVNEKYCCGVKFEPDPDDEYFDWITDEERAELFEMRKTCPNRLVPQIHNYTIQNIPEHKPDQLVACLFSLFKFRYREKLVYRLLRQMLVEDGKELTAPIITTLFNEL